MYFLDDLDRAILAHLATVDKPQTVWAITTALRKHPSAPTHDTIRSRVGGMFAFRHLVCSIPPTRRPAAYTVPPREAQGITLSPSQSCTLAALIALDAPSTATHLQAHLAGQGYTYTRRTLASALSALALHGLARVAGKSQAPTTDGPAPLLWVSARREVPPTVSAASRREWTTASRIKAALTERGPIPARELGRLAKVIPKKIVHRCRTLDAYIIRTGWTEARSVRDDEPKRGYAMIGLACHREQLPDLLRAHMSRVATAKAQAIAQAKPPKAEKPPTPAAPPVPPIAPPPPPAPLAGFLTPDMTQAERIAALRARVARFRATN